MRDGELDTEVREVRQAGKHDGAPEGLLRCIGVSHSGAIVRSGNRASPDEISVLEAIWPRESQPGRRLWCLVGVAFFILNGLINVVLPLFLPVEWVAKN